MNKKRHKLRLRKQVIMCIPIAIILTITVIGIIINKNNVFKSVVDTKKEIATEKFINDNDSKSFSESEFVVSLNKMIEKRQKDNTIIYYAQTFKLNIEKTLEIAYKLTDTYENEAYKKHNVIATSKWQKKIGSFNSFEAGVIYFVRDLYRYPERYGATIEEIRTSEEPTLKKVSKDGNIYMDNGQTFEQYLGRIADLFGIEKSVVLAISYQEAGIKTSNLFRNSNNIGGHRGYSGWMKFTTLEAGVISHVLSIKSLTDKNNIDLSSPTGISSLSGIYVNGNMSKPAASWTEKVTIFVNKINQKDLFNEKK